MDPNNPLAFTEKDFELLAECVKSWEAEPSLTMTMETVMRRLLIGEKVTEEAMQKKISEIEGKLKGRTSTTILLKAKIEFARQLAQAAAIDKA